MDLKHKNNKKSLILFLVLCPWSFVHGLFSPLPAFAASIPPNIAILDSKPTDLKEIEKLIGYRWFEEAWMALMDYPPDDEEVLFLKAQALMGLKKYGESLALFRGIIKTTDKKKRRQESIMKEAMLLVRLKRYDEALITYQKLIDQVHGKTIEKRLLWRAFKTALEARNYKEGVRWSKHLSGQEAIWWRGWCYFQMNDYVHAQNNWEMISKRSDFYPQALYWKAQILKKRGAKEKAESLFQLLTEKFPRTYYGFLSLFELHPKEKEALHFMEAQWFADDNREKWEKTFPEKFEDAVRKESKKRKIDPYLVFALIRQESHFRESVVSPVGAIGLAQLMPQTALFLAKAAKIKPFHLVDILKPEMNLKLGVFYLAFLEKLFEEQTVFAVAAYNAGEEAVSRWLSRRKKMESIEFIEEIPYNETQRYTKKILAAYWIYSWLYKG
ncbi:MAG: transglycosylase SLT domain-containing protein, partial [Deltaproteobacteria bacterium]|nr:transglycosylase SLT domain-containing protein [Deltaproteobacteria bacterium]